MKKIIAMLLTLTLLAGLCVTAGAATSSEVLASVKERIGNTSEYEKFTSNTWENDGHPIYNLYWENAEEDNYDSLSVTVTESGIITDYNEYHDGDYRGDEQPTLNRPPVSEALAAAQAFLQKLNPAIAGELEVTQERSASLRDTMYYFNIRRVVNGIPVRGDTGNITVAADGKTVRNLYMNYTEGLTFEDPASAIGVAAAQRAFAEKLGMRLSYVSRYEKKERTAILQYQPEKVNDTYISALTGEAVTPKRYGDSEAPAMATMESAAKMEDSGAGFTPAEQSELDNLAGLLDKGTLEFLIRENTLLHLGKDMKVTGYSRYKVSEGHYADQFSFSDENDFASVSIDPENVQLLSYHYYDSDPVTKNLYAETRLNDMARELAKKLAGDRFELFREEDAQKGNATWVRYVNDVPFDDDRLYASVNDATGLLASFSISCSDLEFPSPEGVLTPKAAAEKLFAQTEYALCYVPDCSAEGVKHCDKGTLVYAFSEPWSLQTDPFTGELLREREAQAVLPEYTDLEGHYAEAAVNALREYGIGFDTPAYQPWKVITQGEYVSLLNAAFYGGGGVILKVGGDYAETCRMAVRNGLLQDSEVDAEAPLTRDMAAVLLIRAMKLEEVASYSQIYKCPFPDVAEHIGHVSILHAMGVFQGDKDGNFRPADQLNRGDAAIVLYHYLTR